MRKYGPMCMWDVSHVKNFSFACSVLHEEEDAPFNSDLYWDTSSATSMREMFSENREFRGDLSTWDVSKVRDAEKMFCNTRIEDSGIGSWDVRSLVTARGMFTGAVSLRRELNLSRWNVRNCTDLCQMFAGSSITDSGIGKWTLHRDANTFLMLQACAFRGDLSGWHHTKRGMAAARSPPPSFGYRRNSIRDVFV